jgi:hypothetical protein
VKDGLAVVDVALGGQRDDYILIEERGIVGGSFHETAARENFPRARTDELFAGRRGESFAEAVVFGGIGRGSDKFREKSAVG